MEKQAKTALIIGAGPAGLTAAYELISRTDIVPVIVERCDIVGGISRTVEYKGNRMDIGGHRFFSKSDRVMDWWLNILPLQKSSDQNELTIQYQSKTRKVTPSSQGPDPAHTDKVMLVRTRLSRIFYLRKFFDYPIRLNLTTVRNLGLFRIVRIGVSYLLIRIKPIREERNLEDFIINRFGKELYQTFFKDYTEKVWGVPCDQIKPEWGAQRIKGLSITKALWHAFRSIIPRDQSLAQKKLETSLIDKFLYPKFGPGQLWQEVLNACIKGGASILYEHDVVGFDLDGDKLTSIKVKDVNSQTIKSVAADYIFSTMPVKDLINGMHPSVPQEIIDIANGLIYRDFIAVGILLSGMKMGPSKHPRTMVPDNWIYIQEADVKVGRIQVFNNWSPYLVADPNHIWLGLEYFCNESDDLWLMPDDDLIKLALNELIKIGLADEADFLDGVVSRMPKTYPAYFGSYDQFASIRSFTDKINNLFLIGRNGMHKYNNQDHSMLTAMTAVDNIISGENSRNNIWNVNTEEEYHEENK